MNKTASNQQGTIHILSSTGDVQSYIEWRSKYLPTQINFYCTKEVKKLLFHGMLDNVKAPIKRIDEILINNGIWQYNITERNNRIPIINISIYGSVTKNKKNATKITLKNARMMPRTCRRKCSCLTTNIRLLNPTV